MLNCSGYLPFARIAIFCYCKSARIELSSTCVTLWLINNIISYFNVTTKSRWVLNPVSTRTLSIFRPWFFMTIGSHPFNLSISTVFISDKINNWATCDFRGSFFIKEKCFTCCVYQTTILTLFEVPTSSVLYLFLINLFVTFLWKGVKFLVSAYVFCSSVPSGVRHLISDSLIDSILHGISPIVTLTSPPRPSSIKPEP